MLYAIYASSYNEHFYLYIFGLKRSYLTHCSTLSTLACSRPLVSRPTQTFSIEKSPFRALLRSAMAPPSVPTWRRMGRALCKLAGWLRERGRELGLPLK